MPSLKWFVTTFVVAAFAAVLVRISAPPSWGDVTPPGWHLYHYALIGACGFAGAFVGANAYRWLR